MKYVKSEHCTRLTDEHLKVILMVGCCTSKPDLDDILKKDNSINLSNSLNLFIFSTRQPICLVFTTPTYPGNLWSFVFLALDHHK